MLSSSLEILPDSRTRDPKNLRNRGGQFWVPVYCANCGVLGGSVPEHNMTFAFYLCQPCGDKHGEVAGTMKVPDEVFWGQVRAEMEDKGIVEADLPGILSEDSTPLATLLKQQHI